MISLIVGTKGHGKTKKLINMVDETVEKTLGNVVVVEKTKNLGSNITTKARLVDTDSYSVDSLSAFFGFLAGICAGNYDVTDVFVDATLKILGRDYTQLLGFLKEVEKLSKESNAKFVFTISEEKANLPAEIFDFCTLID